MGTRKAIVSPRTLNADNILADSTTEYEATREAESPTPATTNTGKLLPVFAGDVEAATNLDIRLRTAGNVGAARFGYQPTGAIVDAFKGKSAAHIIKYAQTLTVSTNLATPVKRPKLLTLQNGNLVNFCIISNGTILKWDVFDPATGWDGGTNKTVSTVAVESIAAVQIPETLEVLVFTMHLVNGKPVITKWISKSQDTLVFEQSEVYYHSIGAAGTYIPVGIDVERMPSGRLVMLMQLGGSAVATNFSGLVRSFSDDDGSNWATWKRAGDIGVLPDDFTTLTPPPESKGLGNPKIKVLPNGSLLALASARTGVLNPLITGLTTSDRPFMRLLISDDGDTWADMIRITQIRAIASGGNRSIAWGMFPDGAQEGAIAVGDDGLPKLFICQHGGVTTKSVGSKVFDDLCLYTLKKGTITTRDVSPLLPQGAIGNNLVLPSVFDVADLTDVNVTHINPDLTSTTAIVRLPILASPSTDISDLSAKRINCADWDTVGAGTNELDNTPTYQGIKQVDAVNYRGSIWYSAVSESTADAVTSITVFACNSWSALQELPPQTQSATTLNVEGNVYRNSYIATMEPDELNAAWTVSGGGTTSMDTAAAKGGWKVADSTSQTEASTLADFTTGKDFMLRAILIPVSGGTSANDSIAIRIQLADATNWAQASLRFVGGVGGSQLLVRDVVADTTLVFSGAAEDFSKGVEVTIRFTDFDTISGVYYKEIGIDGEAGVETLVGASGSYPLALDNSTVGTTQRVEFGSFLSTTAESIWKVVQYTDGTIATNTRLYNFTGTDAWDAAGTTFHEFQDDWGQWQESIYDDGLRHGTRAPIAASLPMYLTNRLSVFWRGASGSQGDEWTITTASSYGSDKALKAPVRDLWRTTDTSVQATITFDFLQGTNTGEGYIDPDAIALFGFNAHKFNIQLDSTSLFNSAAGFPPVNMIVDTTGVGPATNNRHYYQSTVFVSDDTQTIRLTGASLTAGVNPFSPGQFKSNGSVTWYMYSEQTDQTYTIKDNDLTRLFFDEDVSAVVSGAKYISIFPDKIAISLSGGALSGGDGRATGYRFMRILLPIQTLVEGYFKLGFVVAGRTFDLTDPHPDWSWRQTLTPSVSKIATEFGHKEVVQKSAAVNSWSYAFSGLKGSAYRANTADPPDDRAGWQRWRNFLEQVEWGVKPFALLPNYNNHLDSSSFGSVSFDVYPCIVNGPWSFSHQAYENCNTAAGLSFVKHIGDLASILFEEIL